MCDTVLKSVIDVEEKRNFARAFEGFSNCHRIPTENDCHFPAWNEIEQKCAHECASIDP